MNKSKIELLPFFFLCSRIPYQALRSQKNNHYINKNNQNLKGKPTLNGNDNDKA